MKKYFLALLALLFLALTANGFAATARDITSETVIYAKNGAATKRFLRDRNEDTALLVERVTNPWITVSSENTPCAAIYLEFGSKIYPFSVYGDENGNWQLLAQWDQDYAQAYVSFPPQTELRIEFSTGNAPVTLDIRELFVYSEGELNAEDVHCWLPQAEKADLMVLIAHPDDELLWLGGTLPYYAGEEQMNVCVAYFTCSKFTRRLELLNGLWHCGVRTYPVIGSFRDIKSYHMSDLYQEWGGQKAVDQYVVRLLRCYRPEVVITQAYDGEYGHAAHRLCPDTLTRSIVLSADAAYDPASVEQYGTWQVKKCYVHKTVANMPVTIMDWRQPLDSFNGKTAFEIAEEAYKLHKSQPQTSVKNGHAFFYVVPEHEDNSSFIFTLVHSTVGEDQNGGDFFEHLRP